MKHRSRLSTLAYLSAVHDVRVSLFAALDQAEIRGNADHMGRLAAIPGQARPRPSSAKKRNQRPCRAE